MGAIVENEGEAPPRELEGGSRADAARRARYEGDARRRDQRSRPLETCHRGPHAPPRIAWVGVGEERRNDDRLSHGPTCLPSFLARVAADNLVAALVARIITPPQGEEKTMRVWMMMMMAV